MNKFFAFILILLAITVGVTGCGTGHVKHGGTVTLDDGTPLTKGNVIYITETFQARGTIDAQGQYTIGTYNTADGLPKGTYKVYISGADEDVPGSDGMASYSLIDPAYASFSSTPLTCEIPAPKHTFDITVPKNPNPIPKK